MHSSYEKEEYFYIIVLFHIFYFDICFLHQHLKHLPKQMGRKTDWGLRENKKQLHFIHWEPFVWRALTHQIVFITIWVPLAICDLWQTQQLISNLQIVSLVLIQIVPCLLWT